MEIPHLSHISVPASGMCAPVDHSTKTLSNVSGQTHRLILDGAVPRPLSEMLYGLSALYLCGCLALLMTTGELQIEVIYF